MGHGLLTDAHLNKMDQVALAAAPEPVGPWWLEVICLCRQAFRDSVLVVGDGADARFYKFLFAKKCPRLACFSPLVKKDDEFTAHYDDHFIGEDQVSALMSWQYRFTCDRSVTKDSCQIDDNPDSEVFVIPGLVDFGDELVADGPISRLSAFLHGMKELKGKEKAEEGERAKKTAEQKEAWKVMLSLHPWLLDKRKGSSHRKKASGSAEPAAEDSEEDVDDLEDMVECALDEEEIDVIFETLAALREEWKAKYKNIHLKDFSATVLGGVCTFKATSTKGKKGLVADFIHCEAQSPDAKSFATSYSLQKSKRASINLYGMSAATTLVEGWGHRMQYYLEVYRTSGQPGYTFTAEDHKAYQEPAAFSRLAETLPEVQDAVASIRIVMPFYCCR